MTSFRASLQRPDWPPRRLRHAKRNFLKNKFPQLPCEKGKYFKSQDLLQDSHRDHTYTESDHEKETTLWAPSAAAGAQRSTWDLDNRHGFAKSSGHIVNVSRYLVMHALLLHTNPDLHNHPFVTRRIPVCSRPVSLFVAEPRMLRGELVTPRVRLPRCRRANSSSLG